MIGNHPPLSPNPLRVIIFSGAHGAGFGAERVLEHLLEAASSAVCLVIAPPGSGVEAVAHAHGIATLAWNSPNNSTWGNLIAWLRFDAQKARRYSGNLLQVWHTRGFEWGLALSRCLRIPVCGVLHDDPTSTQNSSIRRFLLRTVANRMKAMAVVSEALHQICAKERWTVPMTIIRNGLPDDPSLKPREIGPNLRIGFLGLNEPWKGLEIVTALVASLQSFPVVWHFFGSPSARTRPFIEQLIAKFPAKVRFHGRQTPAEIYSRVDIILHPSMAFDPYPTVLLEAARAGVPVVASAIGGAPEIVNDRVTGRLFSPSDASGAELAIRSLLDNSDIRLKMGKAARARYETHFPVVRMATAYEAFWLKVLGGCRS